MGKKTKIINVDSKTLKELVKGLALTLEGLAVSALVIGTFAPMLIRIGFAKWRDSLVRRYLTP